VNDELGCLHARTPRVGATQSSTAHGRRFRGLPVALSGAGLSLLDVGCAPGRSPPTLPLWSPRAGDGDRPIPRCPHVAHAEIQRSNLSNVSFAAADVHRLDCPDDTFDVVHAHKCCACRRPGQALREMRRVCVPGGMWRPETPTTRVSSGSRAFLRWILARHLPAGCSS